MFTFDTIIDNVKGVQTKVVETYVTDKKVQSEMVKLVEAQASFAKDTYQISLSLAQLAFKGIGETVASKKGA